MRLQENSLVMDHLSDLIQIYENALDDKVCSSLIKVFEDQSRLHENVFNQRKPNFVQLNLTNILKNSKNIEYLHFEVVKSIIKHKKIYLEKMSNNFFPDTNLLEELRIKRYVPNLDQAFDTHIDVTDCESSKRFLSFLFYLNDVEIGGETVFKDLTIKPKTGKLVIFPPMWMFPHSGKEPIDKNKYIVSTYLHYKSSLNG